MTITAPTLAWHAFLASGMGEPDLEKLRRHERTGRPSENAGFLGRVENGSGRTIRRATGPEGRAIAALIGLAWIDILNRLQ